MRVEMVDPQGQILAELADPNMKQRDIMLTYAFCLRSPVGIDWRAINEAILERWSLSGLKRIKAGAWRLAS